MAPLSGIVDLYGPEISWACELAVEEINAAGGLLGRTLELVIEDDGSMPESALRAAERLLEVHGCSALIGNLLSNSRIAVADQVAEPNAVPYLNFSFYEGSISGRFFFHFAALPNQQIEQMIPFMAERYGPKMFFAGNNYEWPRGSIDAAKRSLRRIGGEVVGEEYLPLGLPAGPIETLLDQVATSGADVFVPYFAGGDQIQLLNGFAARGLKKRMAVVMGHYDEAMVRFLSPEVRAGFYSSNTYFMSVATARSRAYLKRLRAHPQVDAIWPEGRGVLTNFGEAAYCCVLAYAQAVKAAGGTEPEALVAALEQVRVDSCQGEVRMDPRTHHAEVNSFLARCRADGTFELIESFGRIAPLIPERYRPRDEPKLSVTEVFSRPRLADLPVCGSNASVSDIFQRILDTADVAVIASNIDGQILQANLGAARMFGYRLEELTALSVDALLPPHQRHGHREAMRAFERGPVHYLPMGHRGEIAGYRKDGTLFPAEASISKFIDGDRSVLVATLHDISAKKLAEQQLQWRATHHQLTGLPNRLLIRDRLEHALRRSERGRRWVAVLAIDLDHFKLINDNYGHEIGDEALVRVAERLLDHVRPGDTVGHLGADEFVVLCENVERTNDVIQLAEQINIALRLALNLDGYDLICTASIGLALGQGTAIGADELMRNADVAMYASKEQGRDTWRPFSQGLSEQSRERLSLVTGLRHAIARNELSLVFQPIVAARTLRIHGAEALLRWQPDSGPVSPATFVPIAEQSGAIIEIGRWVFEQVCAAQQRLEQACDAEPPYLSLNLSAVQLNDEHIIDDFTHILERTGANPERLLLELTETSLFADVEKNLRIRRALANLGLQVAVDDFGTGYSSLLQLLRLPISSIKIDREFVDGIEQRQDARLIISAMIKMGKALGKRLIAEGVENETQLFELQALQCDALQGFHLHRPMPEQALLQTLEQTRQQPQREAPQVYYLIYISNAGEAIAPEHVQGIVTESRESNASEGITGLLIHQNGYFMQLLEGRREPVEALMARIAEDPRHSEPLVVVRGYARQRLFSNWSMGFWDLEATAGADSQPTAQHSRSISLLKASEDARFCYALFEALSAAA
jgi:diguanylate cyclase (GGDEF)-like protein/PAS domain S-box-containing protein